MAAHRCVATPHIRPVGWPGTVDPGISTQRRALPCHMAGRTTQPREGDGRSNLAVAMSTHRAHIGGSARTKMPARSQDRPEQVTLIREIVSESRRRAPTRRPRIAGSDTSQ